MDLEKAVGLVLAEAKRIGQNEMARRLDVSNGTMSKWKGKTRPQAEQRQRVFAEARRIQAESEAAAEAAAFVVGAVATESHHVEMARISGYVEAVRDMVLQVASRQTDILGMLQPWVAAEASSRPRKQRPFGVGRKQDRPVKEEIQERRVQHPFRQVATPNNRVTVWREHAHRQFRVPGPRRQDVIRSGHNRVDNRPDHSADNRGRVEHRAGRFGSCSVYGRTVL
jgi:hypothetical protein